MRKFLVKNFALYSILKSNVLMIFGSIMMLGSITGFLMLAMNLNVFISMLAISFCLWLIGNSIKNKQSYSVLRASKFIVGAFLLTAIAGEYSEVLMYIGMGVIALFVWLSFDLFGYGYFALYPPIWSELDDEQKYQYGFSVGAEKTMTKEQKKEWKSLVSKMEKNN